MKISALLRAYILIGDMISMYEKALKQCYKQLQTNVIQTNHKSDKKW